MESTARGPRLGLLSGSVVAVAAVLEALPGTTVTVGSGATIRIESASLDASESAIVALEGVDFPTPGLGAITVDVVYDRTAVAAAACEADPQELFGLSLCNHDFASDTIRVTAVDAQGKAGDFVLAKISFAPVDGAGHADLHVTAVTLADPAGAGIEVLVEEGEMSLAVASKSTELPAAPSEGTELAASTADSGSESVEAPPSASQLPATGSHPLLHTDQPWLYPAIAALGIGVAASGLALIRRRPRAQRKPMTRKNSLVVAHTG